MARHRPRTRWLHDPALGWLDTLEEDTDDMPLTGATVGAALAAVGAVGNQIASMDALAAGADDALRQAPPGLTPAGAASFLATMAQESAYFRTTTEYGTGQRYAPFIGRTFEQITWESNYRLFGQWCRAHGLLTDGEAFVRNPRSLSDYRWAWLGGVWYFEANGLWRHANAGNHYAVSQGVNRGVGAIGSNKAPLHWTQRKAMYDAFLRAGDALLPTARPQEDDLPTPADVWQHPIDDPYTPKAGDTQPAHVVLAWLGANAAVARADAAEAKAAAERCEHKLDQLLARLG